MYWLQVLMHQQLIQSLLQDQQSLLMHCNNWIQKIKQYMLPHSKIILVGNCIDLEKNRVISYNIALKFAQHNNIDYYECSAKKNKKALRKIMNNRFITVYKKL